MTNDEFKTWIYDHRNHPFSFEEDRFHLGILHDPRKIPPPGCDSDTGPIIMVEPSGSGCLDEIYLYFRGLWPVFLSRDIAEQLRDALIKVCQKPRIDDKPKAIDRCECHLCIENRDLRGKTGLPLDMERMIVCQECGNKRCPKASNHELSCTGSNEFGQQGSIYGTD